MWAWSAQPTGSASSIQRRGGAVPLQSPEAQHPRQRLARNRPRRQCGVSARLTPSSAATADTRARGRRGRRPPRGRACPAPARRRQNALPQHRAWIRARHQSVEACSRDQDAAHQSFVGRCHTGPIPAIPAPPPLRRGATARPRAASRAGVPRPEGRCRAGDGEPVAAHPDQVDTRIRRHAAPVLSPWSVPTCRQRWARQRGAPCT